METKKERRIAEFFRAFGNEWRILMVSHLVNKSYSVKELAEAIKKDSAFVSNHLKVLKGVGLLEYQIKGHTHEYFIKKQKIDEILDSARDELFRHNK